MRVLKLIAGCLFLVVCLAYYPLWALGAMLLGGGLFLSFYEASARRHEEIMARLSTLGKAGTTPPPQPPRPRIGYTSSEDYRAYRQAHGLPYTSVESMWSDGS